MPDSENGPHRDDVPDYVQHHRALMDEMGLSQDEAAHMLVDMGEIDSTEHAELLTDAERERIYG
jgi:hypothetical protein